MSNKVIVIFLLMVGSAGLLSSQSTCTDFPASFRDHAKPMPGEMILESWGGTLDLPLSTGSLQVVVELNGGFSSVLLRTKTDDGYSYDESHFLSRKHKKPERVRNPIVAFPAALEIRISTIGIYDHPMLRKNIQPMTDEALRLKFKGRWSGSQEVFEIPSRDTYQLWSESPSPAVHWLELDVPADNVALTKTLHVEVLNEHQDQIACFSAHL